MKSFTDIGQSEKLAEILPINSADMCYRIVAYNSNDTHEYQPYCFVKTLESDIPCWSLTALLDISPYIEVGRELYGAHHGKWYSRYTTGDYQYKTIADNLIDACYEMILKLHDQKLL